ncbi:unnamed protein product [Closterium sp. NIES-53]
MSLFGAPPAAEAPNQTHAPSHSRSNSFFHGRRHSRSSSLVFKDFPPQISHQRDPSFAEWTGGKDPRTLAPSSSPPQPTVPPQEPSDSCPLDSTSPLPNLFPLKELQQAPSPPSLPQLGKVKEQWRSISSLSLPRAFSGRLEHLAIPSPSVDHASKNRPHPFSLFLSSLHDSPSEGSAEPSPASLINSPNFPNSLISPDSLNSPCYSYSTSTSSAASTPFGGPPSLSSLTTTPSSASPSSSTWSDLSPSVASSCSSAASPYPLLRLALDSPSARTPSVRSPSASAKGAAARLFDSPRSRCQSPLSQNSFLPSHLQPSAHHGAFSRSGSGGAAAPSLLGGAASASACADGAVSGNMLTSPAAAGGSPSGGTCSAQMNERTESAGDITSGSSDGSYPQTGRASADTCQESTAELDRGLTDMAAAAAIAAAVGGPWVAADRFRVESSAAAERRAERWAGGISAAEGCAQKQRAGERNAQAGSMERAAERNWEAGSGSGREKGSGQGSRGRGRGSSGSGSGSPSGSGSESGSPSRERMLHAVSSLTLLRDVLEKEKYSHHRRKQQQQQQEPQRQHDRSAGIETDSDDPGRRRRSKDGNRSGSGSGSEGEAGSRSGRHRRDSYSDGQGDGHRHRHEGRQQGKEKGVGAESNERQMYRQKRHQQHYERHHHQHRHSQQPERAVQGRERRDSADFWLYKSSSVGGGAVGGPQHMSVSRSSSGGSSGSNGSSVCSSSNASPSSRRSLSPLGSLPSSPHSPFLPSPGVSPSFPASHSEPPSPLPSVHSLQASSLAPSLSSPSQPTSYHQRQAPLSSHAPGSKRRWLLSLLRGGSSSSGSSSSGASSGSISGSSNSNSSNSDNGSSGASGGISSSSSSSSGGNGSGSGRSCKSVGIEKLQQPQGSTHSPRRRLGLSLVAGTSSALSPCGGKKGNEDEGVECSEGSALEDVASAGLTGRVLGGREGVPDKSSAALEENRRGGVAMERSKGPEGTMKVGRGREKQSEGRSSAGQVVEDQVWEVTACLQPKTL